MLRRALASFLSAAVILLSPGLASYAAAGEIAAARPSAAPLTGAKSVTMPSLPTLPAALSLGQTLPSVNAGVSTGVSAPSAVVSASKSAAAPAAAALKAPLPASVYAASAKAEASRAAVSSAVAGQAKQVANTLSSLGDMGSASAGDARAAGVHLSDVLTGGKAQASADDVAVTPGAEMGSLGGTGDSGLSYANPAGKDSIGAAAAAYYGQPGGPGALPPPKSPNGGGNGDGQGPKKAPLVPRLLSAALALAPAALIGWPLLAAGSFVAGGLTILASLGVAALPFMSEGTPAFACSIPGVVIGALGLTALAAGAVAAVPSAIAMGAVVVLGGWGFMRFAKKGGRSYDSAQDTIAAFFGALGAVTGAGLVLLAPGGVIAGALTIAAYPVTLALFMYLPGWIGKSLTAAVEGVFMSVKDAFRVFTSLRRDTTLRKRLEAYSRASIERSPWNAVWLSLLVWLPVAASELASMAVGAAGGLALGALRLPFMLLWGASHAISKESKATKFLASWTQGLFAGSKVELFNRFEMPLIGAANSDSKLKSMPAAFAIRLMQLSWLAYNLASFPFRVGYGFFKAFGAVNEPYDPNKHSPDYLRLGNDPLPAAVPEVGKPEVTSALPSKLLAAGIALSPLWLLGAPLFSVGFLGWGMIAAVVSIGVMPLMPTGDSLPAFLRRLPATLLTVTGAFSAIGAARMALFVGLPTGWILPLGIVAFLGGIGLKALIEKLRNPETKAWQVDEPEYIGGFAASLFLTAALGAALLGAAGPLVMALNVAALALSPLLLYHLPKHLWKGVGTGLWAVPHGVRSVYQVMESWHDEAGFGRSLSAWYSYWTRKSVWYGAMFLVPFALQLASYVFDVAAATAVGAAVGLVRLPTAFFWGWSYGKDLKSKPARFWAGFNHYLIERVEGSKKAAFDPILNTLKPALEDKNPQTSRPTLKALGALLALRLAQVYWLARILVLTALSPVLWALAAIAGAKNAQGEKTKTDPWNDPDRPDLR